MEHLVQISIETVPSRHAVLNSIVLWDWVATSPHAVISWLEIIMRELMVMTGNGAVWMRRIGLE